jgi:hypothetical protein
MWKFGTSLVFLNFQTVFLAFFIFVYCEARVVYPFTDLQFDDFFKSLANISASLLNRDTKEIFQSLVLTFGAQGIARQMSQKLRPIYRSDSFLVCEIIRCKRIDLGVKLSGLVYEPSFFERKVCNERERDKILSDFDVMSSERDATFLRPSYALLRSKMEAVSWVVIRGTTSVDDLLTSLTTIAEPFMDGFVHSGILRAADTICRIVRKHLVKGDRIWLTGHSLGGATAAICTGDRDPICRASFLARACRSLRPDQPPNTEHASSSHPPRRRLQRQGRRLRAPRLHTPRQPRRPRRPRRGEGGSGGRGAAGGAAALARRVGHR